MHHTQPQALTRLVAAGSLSLALLTASPAASASSTRESLAPARTLRLITGDTFVFTTTPGSRSPALTPAAPTAAGSVITIKAAGQTYVLPPAALPYLGHGLNPDLFDLAALLKAESAGRLPVRMSYQGPQPALPGVKITAASRGTALGYLTATSAKDFGAALDRQFAADHADAGYGTDGMFGNNLTISLAGRAARNAAAPRAPHYPMKTLTVTGTNRAGRPDTGDEVLIVNVDNSGRLDFIDSGASFYRGVAKLSVPVGHYFAIGFFFGSSPSGGPLPVTHALDILPQFTVSDDTTVHVAERAADSKITMRTRRPAAVMNTEFDIIRTPRSGPTELLNFINFRWLGANAPIWVSPTTTRPTAGSLATVTDQWLASRRATAPYEYDLAYQNLTGQIPPQHYVVRTASLAVISARYYLAGKGGFLSRVGVFPVQAGSLAFTYDPVNMPGTRTIYSSARPELIWATSLYTASQGFPGALLQSDAERIYRAGQRLTENWDAYPLHPGANVDVIGAQAGAVTLPSASRSGDTLTLDFTPFSDSTPGHTGAGFSTNFGTKVSGTYEIDQNGKRLAGGNAAAASFGNPDLRVQATLSPHRSTIRFSLSAALSGAAGQLSARSQTTWTWRSAHQSRGSLPPGWICGSFAPSCRVEPLLTLGYSVPKMSPRGSAPAGRQVVKLCVRHLQLARAARITVAKVQVSFDGGRTWRKARVTATSRGRFRAVFTARPGASVTLRTSAADAAGATITEIITRAYSVAPRRRTSGPRAARPACAAPQPGQMRCFALYARGVHAAPKGWGALDIESAYKLPVSSNSQQTVAVVDAYRTPGLASSVAAYRAEYGLPTCYVSSGCLRVVNQAGRSSPLPVSGVPYGWDVETALDVEMVSAACPLCKILVVEARTPSFSDLATAENIAARLGAQVISDSYGSPESGRTQAFAHAYNHPGHVIVVASGDLGFTAANFPANLSTVTAAGGTQLARSTNTRGWTERTWNSQGGGSGSGCSAYVAKPAWQRDPHCGLRTVADVSAVASNVAVYDKARGGWLLVGGTSAAAPLIAGVYGLAGNASTIKPGYEYRHVASLFDVTAGNNDVLNGTAGATCGYDYLCVAKENYDAPTGLGSPDGIGAF